MMTIVSNLYALGKGAPDGFNQYTQTRSTKQRIYKAVATTAITMATGAFVNYCYKAGEPFDMGPQMATMANTTAVVPLNVAQRLLSSTPLCNTTSYCAPFVGGKIWGPASAGDTCTIETPTFELPRPLGGYIAYTDADYETTLIALRNGTMGYSLDTINRIWLGLGPERTLMT